MIRFQTIASSSLMAGFTLTAMHVHAITIATVPVGNSSNAADTQVMDDGTSGYGSVPYAFRMGTAEVTNAQYVAFLNAVAGADPYGLYDPMMGTSIPGGIVRNGSPGTYTYSVKSDAIGQGPGGSNYTYGNKPVVFVSWFDAIRFANWMHNAQGSAGTETGAYTLFGGTPVPSNANSIVRNPGAQWWLPSENEWYKSAYYNPAGAIYYDYPTGTNSVPNNSLPSADTGNSANFFSSNFTTGSVPFPLTDAGAYTLTASPYGALDQAGSVFEWHEGLFIFGSSLRFARGGSWSTGSGELDAADRANLFMSNDGYNNIGFRVATIIPEPSALVLFGVGLSILLMDHRFSWAAPRRPRPSR